MTSPANAKIGSWLLYIVLIVLAFGLGAFLRSVPDQEDTALQSSAASSVITVDESGWTACPTRLGFETFSRLTSSGDEAASARTYETYGCTTIRKGQPVYREAGSAFGTVVGIRYVGETRIRWTAADALR